MYRIKGSASLLYLSMFIIIKNFAIKILAVELRLYTNISIKEAE